MSARPDYTLPRPSTNQPPPTKEPMSGIENRPRMAAGKWTRLLTPVLAVVMLGLPVATLPTGRAPSHERLTPVFEALPGCAVGAPCPGCAAGAPCKGETGSWLSSRAAAGRDFALVGATWSRSDKTGKASIRTSKNGITWSPWKELEANDAGPDRMSPEYRSFTSAEPIWVGHARFVQTRWNGARPPSTLRIHTIDPGSDPALPRSSAAAAPGRPDIISRRQWGANESIRKCCPTSAPSVDFAVVHHTATDNDYKPEEASDVVRAIYEYHVKVNGWHDIGYNFLIDRFGRVYEGRAGGIREPIIGAHSEGFNTRSTGVSVMGSFQSAPLPGVALASLKKLIAWKLDIHHVDPRGSTKVISAGSKLHPPGRTVAVKAVAAHRELQDTACPGNRIMETLPRVRTDAYGIGLPKIFRPTVTPSVFTPNGDGNADVLRAQAKLSDGAAWRVRIRNDAGTFLQTFTGTGQADARWSGMSPSGEPAPHGFYKVDITATQGNATATPAEVVAGLYRDPWGAWTRVGNTLLGAARAPRVTAGPNGTFHMLTRDSGGGLMHSRWSGGAWETSQRLGASGDTAANDGRLGLAQGTEGTLHAVIRGKNSNIYHGRILSNGSFTGWQRIGGAGDKGRDVAVASDSSGVVHVLIVGMNGNIYGNRYSNGWTSWKRVGAEQDKGAQPTLATGNEGDVLAVIVAPSSGIYANKLDPGRGWRSRWTGVGRSLGQGREPAIAPLAEGFAVFVRGQSTPNVWQSIGTIGLWSSWSRVGSASDVGYEPAAVNTEGDVVLVVRGRSSGRIYANVRAPDGGWRGWDEAGDSLQEGVVPTLATNGRNVMLAAEVPGQAPATIVAQPPIRSR